MRGFRNRPKLSIPKFVKDKVFSAGKYIRLSFEKQSNDDGAVKDGKIWRYHPTKGWRRVALPYVGHNLTVKLVEDYLATQPRS